MKMLHDEAFYEEVYNPEEVEYAITLVKLRKYLKNLREASRFIFLLLDFIIDFMFV